MRKYVFRITLFFSPLLLLLSTFLILDPFAMVHGGAKGYVVPESANDDYNTFNTFDSNNDSLQYNAFIMGNSKTLAILSTDWKKHIGQDQRVYKFGAPGESILNMRKKLEYVVSKGNRLDHVILLFDNKLLANTDNSSPDLQGPVYLKTPKSSNNLYLDYFAKGFYYFLYDGYFVNYFSGILKNKYSIGKIRKEEMTINDFAYSNEFIRKELEEKIQFDSLGWCEAFEYKTNTNSKSTKIVFAVRDSMHLVAIKKLFVEYDTEYKILFVPDFDCSYNVRSSILKSFKSIFSDTTVFAGFDLVDICENPFYFYDQTHFRPIVGREILKRIYSKNGK